MEYLSQIAFLATLLVAGYFLSKRILFIRDSIRLGKPMETSGSTGDRWKNVFLIAFGQKKMFKRFIPAIFHFFIYFGFLVINLEVLEFVIDGLAGTHRIFAPYLGSVYSLAISFFELLALLVLIACVIFLIRRNFLKVPRFWSAEMTKWPRLMVI